MVEPAPLHWKRGVLNIGLPGKSPVFILFCEKMRESDCLTQILKKIEVDQLFLALRIQNYHCYHPPRECIFFGPQMYVFNPVSFGCSLTLTRNQGGHQVGMILHVRVITCREITLVGLSFNIFKRKGTQFQPF